MDFNNEQIKELMVQSMEDQPDMQAIVESLTPAQIEMFVKYQEAFNEALGDLTMEQLGEIEDLTGLTSDQFNNNQSVKGLLAQAWVWQQKEDHPIGYSMLKQWPKRKIEEYLEGKVQQFYKEPADVGNLDGSASRKEQT